MRDSEGAMSHNVTFYETIIFEEERCKMPEFTIGKIIDLTNKKVTVKHFTGIARWEGEPKIIKLSNLTCCQVGSNYLNVYERYFNK